MNLLVNSIKYGKENGSTLIGFYDMDENILVEITDNGIGIEEQYKEQIFGLFRRLHSQHEYEGTGIGLAICQKIVHRYNGRIWVESRPGEGSTAA